MSGKKIGKMNLEEICLPLGSNLVIFTLPYIWEAAKWLRAWALEPDILVQLLALV